MRSCCSTPRTVVAGGHSATSAQAPCRSTRRSNASATIHISWNCARHSGEPPQRIDAKSEGLPWKLQLSYPDFRNSDGPAQDVHPLWMTGQREITAGWPFSRHGGYPGQAGGAGSRSSYAPCGTDSDKPRTPSLRPMGTTETALVVLNSG